VVHCDIKPANILIGNGGVLKICDFGISKFLPKGEQVKKIGGTRAFQAPEAWNPDIQKGMPVDIWALGVTFYFLAFGKYPFLCSNLDDFKRDVENKEPEFPDDIEVGFVQLLKKCLIKDPKARIIIDDILKDDWLTNCGESPLPKLAEPPIQASMDEIHNAFTPKLLEASLFAVCRLKATAEKTRRRLSQRSKLI